MVTNADLADVPGGIIATDERSSNQPDPVANHSPRRNRRWPAAICCGLYLGLSFATFGMFSSLGAGQISGVRSLDQIQQIWFIEWAYYAIAHGHNPFFTQLQIIPWA